MYDSTSPSDIPADAQMVAGYADGAYVWRQADWDRFPTAAKVTISTQPGSTIADVLDVELGDATPSDAARWVQARTDAGFLRPTVYCARSSMSTVAAALSGMKYELWVADWTGQPHAIEGAVAVQYANPSTSGGHFDLSVVYDDFWPLTDPSTSPGEPMDLDTARSIVHVTLAMNDLLGDQEQVDAYASRMVPPNNPEDALTDLERDIKADPRSLYSRTTAHLSGH